MNISENIKKYRKMKGLTQKDLADAIGVSVQAISKWECGGTPDISQIQPLCTTLGTTPNELLGAVKHYEAQNKKWFEIMCTYGEGSLELIAFDREVLKEYPNDHLYSFRLATDLQMYARDCKDKAEAMRYYQASKRQYEENLKRNPGDEVNLAQLVAVCVKLGLREEALRHALSSSRKDTLLKLVYEGEELIRHKQSLINSLLRSLIMEIARLDENKIECERTCQNLLRAIFPDGNMQSFYRYMMVSKIHEAGEYVRIGNYDAAMKALWQTLDLVKEEHSHLHKKEFTSPLFDRLDAGRDYIYEGMDSWRAVYRSRRGNGTYFQAVLTENGLFYPYLCDREDMKALLDEVNAIAEMEKTLTD